MSSQCASILAVAITISLALSGCGNPSPSTCAPGETQECYCSGGGTGVQTCSSSGSSWGACVGCSSTGSPDAGMCRPAGVSTLVCGCWGYAVDGQIVSATGCCSGFARQSLCGGSPPCPAGGYPWANVCTP